MKKTCLCCGFKTLESEIHDICPICFWQDDPAAWNDPDFVGGANGPVSLRKAQLNFMEFGACEKVMLDSVREPTEQDEKDPNWKPSSRTIKLKSATNIVQEVEEARRKYRGLKEKRNIEMEKSSMTELFTDKEKEEYQKLQQELSDENSQQERQQANASINHLFLHALYRENAGIGDMKNRYLKRLVTLAEKLRYSEINEHERLELIEKCEKIIQDAREKGKSD